MMHIIIGNKLWDMIRHWVESRDPHSLQQLIIALIRFMNDEGRGLCCLDSVTVRRNGEVNILESDLVEVGSYPRRHLFLVSLEMCII